MCRKVYLTTSPPELSLQIICTCTIGVSEKLFKVSTNQKQDLSIAAMFFAGSVQNYVHLEDITNINCINLQIICSCSLREDFFCFCITETRIWWPYFYQNSYKMRTFGGGSHKNIVYQLTNHLNLDSISSEDF
jgi:hypothetical protein